MIYRILFGLFALCFALTPNQVAAQCTTTDATGCECPFGRPSCDLLPDITISEYAVLNYLDGPTEYAQTGNGVNNGRLRLTGSTPNIGYGPLTIGAVDIWTCGTDTFTDFNAASAVCANPSQLIKQKIYHKDGNTMSFTERWAGSMTYHPTHGHMHVDEWGVFSLRIEDPNESNPLNWPIVGTGAKVGFCLMDFGSCSFYDGHCTDDQGNVLNQNAQFPNYGLGGGQYNCSPVEQGISVGYTDIYSENLDGMWIDIPPGTCNGDYYIVIEIDPNNNFLESDETNNWLALPFTLTEQVPSGSNTAQITAEGSTDLCSGESVTLSANPGTAYLWSTGETTQSITVNTGGNYTVEVTNSCGTGVSAPVEVVASTVIAPQVNDTAFCAAASVTLSAQASGTVEWYDVASGGTAISTGATFATPVLSETTTYYAQNLEGTIGPVHYSAPHSNTIGGQGYAGSGFNGYLSFDAETAFELKSVKTFTEFAGVRIIELRDNNGNVLQSRTVSIAGSGESRVELNFNVPAGIGYQLGTEPNSNIRLFGDESPELRRNNGGVAYPYTIPNVLAITGSRYGAQYYYYFYDWEVDLPDEFCASTRVPVLVEVGAGFIPSINVNGQVLSAGSGSNFQWYFNGQMLEGMNSSAIGVDQTGYYQVSMTSNDGCSGISDSVFVEIAASCDVPANLTVERTGLNSVRLFWDPGVAHVGARVKGNRVDLSQLLQINVSGQSYVDVNNLNVNDTYKWQVRGDCGSMVSGYSAFDTFSIAQMAGCEVPTGLNVAINDPTSATLQWATVNGAEKYQIKGRPLNAGSFVTLHVDAPANWFAVNGLQPGTSYEWQIRAKCNSTGTYRSAYSAQHIFMMPAANNSRLQSDEFDQKSSFEMALHPNPTKGLVQLSLETEYSGSIEVVMTNHLGQAVNRFVFDKDESNLKQLLNLSRHSAGVYFLQVKAGNQHKTERIILH